MKARPLSTIGGPGVAAALEAKQRRDSELELEKRSASPQPPTPNDDSLVIIIFSYIISFQQSHITHSSWHHCHPT